MSTWWIPVLLLLLHPMVGVSDGENDAGSGGDAGDLFLLPLVVGPGLHQGNLSGVTDTADNYGVMAPVLSILRIKAVLADPVVMKVFDPTGAFRGCVRASTGDSFSAVTYPTGRWEVRFDRGFCGGVISMPPRNPATGLALEPSPYAFDLRLEAHDHFERLAYETNTTLAFRIGLQPHAFSRIEMDLERVDGNLGPWTEAVAVQLESGGEPPQNYVFYGSWTPALGFGDINVWSSGTPLNGISVSLPIARAAPPLSGEPPPQIVVEGAPAQQVAVSLAYVHTTGFVTTGWLVWDDMMDHASLEGTQIVQIRLRDFEAEGVALQTGPYVHAGRATTTYEATGPNGLVHINARHPTLDPALPPVQTTDPRFAVRTPGGEELELVDESAFWSGTDLQKGQWEVVVRDLSGAWGDTVVVTGIRFPF